MEVYGGGGFWSLNLLRAQIKKFAREKVDELLHGDLEAKYPELSGATYEHTEMFYSGGENLGLGLRFYPGGEQGSFSVGFYLMKMNMDMVMDGEIAATKGTDSADFTGSGEVYITSYAGLAVLQWEFFPSLKVTPYFKMGFGAGTLRGKTSYKGFVTTRIRGNTEKFKEEEEKTLDDLRKEGADVPKLLPFVNLALGIKGDVSENLALYVEGGILNGFFLGGSFGIRF